MILVFLGSARAAVGVFLSIPLSALATFIALGLGHGTVNTMILGGLALAFSRLIDNSVVVLENISRHIELGETPIIAAEKGGREVSLPVLAATLATVVGVLSGHVFVWCEPLPVWRSCAGGRASFVCLLLCHQNAMTVVPLFCARFLKAHDAHPAGAGHRASRFERFNVWFNLKFQKLLDAYDRLLEYTLRRPTATLIAFSIVFLLSLGLMPLVGLAYFPRTEPSQFVINLKAPTGTRLENTEELVKKVERIVSEEVSPQELGVVVANIGVTPGFSSIYTPNSAQHTAFVQASLKPDHKIGSYEYMDRVRKRIAKELPELSAYLQSGGLVDAVLNLGLPAPIDIQVSGSGYRSRASDCFRAGRKNSPAQRRQRCARAAGR